MIKLYAKDSKYKGSGYRYLDSLSEDMPPVRKYEDFVETEAHEMPSKHESGQTRFYISITCPHCKKVFVDIPEEQMKTSKASRCLQHLRVCDTFKAKGGKVTSPPEKIYKDPAIANLTESIEALESTVASHNAEIQDMNDKMASICEENAWLKSENAELETALANARAALRSQRKRLLSTLESVDVHSQMGFPIMKLDNGLC